MKLLFHFILCSFASSLNLTNICETISLSKNYVEEQFWMILPQPNIKESMVTYVNKLETLSNEINEFPD